MNPNDFRSQIGTGEGESPLAPRPAMPPTPPLEARTFSSDLGSIRNTGGSEPVPYVPSSTPKPPAVSSPVAAPRPPMNPPSGIGMGTFPKSGGMPPSVTPPPPFGTSPAPLVQGAPKRGGKKVFVAILSFLIVIALGAIGYFFVYPLFVGEIPPATPPPTASQLPESEIPEVPVLPGEEATSTEEAGTPETPVVDPFDGVQGLTSHRSLFRTSADTVTEVILTAPTRTAFTSALPSGSVATSLFSEVVLKMPSGAVLPFSTLAPLLAPTFFTPARLASFDDDATYFTYAAANGTWLGIVVPLKAGVPIGPVQDGMSALQADPALANFFLENPGEQGVWADGSVRTKPTSQVSFEAPGATFSYTWFDRNLLISTNLTGAGTAAERLGF